MNRGEIRKLVGGYATGTLSAEERAALFAAAMDDQALFDALANEQALRDLLADPAARAHLLAALGEPEPGLAAMVMAWWRRPAGAALAAAMALGVVAFTIAHMRKPPVPEAPTQVAQVRQEPATAPPQAPPPATQPERQAPVPARPVRRAELQVPRLAAAPPVNQPGGNVVVETAPSPPLAAPALDLARKEEAVLAPPPPPPPIQTAPSPVAPRALFSARKPLVAEAESKVRMDAVAGYGGAASGISRASLLATAHSLLQCSVERAAFEGRFEPVAADGVVHMGESIRLAIVSPAAGWIYLLESGGAGTWRMAANGQVAPGKPFRFPAEGTFQPGEPGRKEWRAVFSVQPLATWPSTPSPGAATITVDVAKP